MFQKRKIKRVLIENLRRKTL